MSNRLYIKNIGFVLLALSFGLSPNPAHAGFQWVAPSGVAAAPTPDASAPAPIPESEPVTPVVTGAPQALSPVVIDNNNQPSASVISSPPPAETPPVSLTPPATQQVVVPAESVVVPPVQENTSPPPVVIEGTERPSTVKPETHTTVIIQGNNAVPSAPSGGGEPIPVAGGELVPSTPQAAVVVSPPSAVAPEMPSASYTVTESSPTTARTMPLETPADTSAPAPALAITPSSTSATVTLSSPESASVAESATTSSLQPEAPPSITPAPPPPTARIATTDVVHGFANHVPLAVALRQILPTGYGFSVDQNVDLGVLVSFQGGKAWHDTLDEALAPAGLVAHDQGQMVEISYPSGKEPKGSASTDIGTPVTLSSSAAPSVQSHLSDSYSAAQPPVISAPALIPSPVLIQQAWDAEPGDSLHKVLEDWSRRANVEFDWMAEYDYPLQASVHLKGSFEDAVRGLLTGFEAAHPQPIAELHANAKVGQMVLVVTTRGNSTD